MGIESNGGGKEDTLKQMLQARQADSDAAVRIRDTTPVRCSSFRVLELKGSGTLFSDKPINPSRIKKKSDLMYND